MIKLTKSLKAILIKKMNNHDSYAEGSSAEFYKLTKTIGAKLFYLYSGSLQNRNFAQRNQAKAYRNRLAPETGESFDLKGTEIGDNYNCNVYGYLTQIANDNFKTYPDSNGYYRLQFIDVLKISQLAIKMKLFHFNHRDCLDRYPGFTKQNPIKDMEGRILAQNLGFIGKRLVCIDFDHVSMQL